MSLVQLFNKTNIFVVEFYVTHDVRDTLLESFSLKDNEL